MEEIRQAIKEADAAMDKLAASKAEADAKLVALAQLLAAKVQSAPQG